ncbi:MAG: MFS transporter [Acidimicrobiales bacterium]
MTSVDRRPADGLPTVEARPYRMVMGALILFLQFALGLNMFSISPLLPLVIDDYDVSRTWASLLVAGPLLMQAATGIPGSLVIGRYGLRRTVFVGSVLVGSLSLAFLFDGFLMIAVLRLLSGAGAGLLIAGTGPVIMRWFAGRAVPVMNTLFLTALSSGIAIGVLASAPLASSTGWRNVLGVFGLFPLIGAAAWFLFSRTATTTSALPEAFGVAEAWGVLRDRTIFSLVTADALVFVQYAVLTSWLPTFFHESRGMSLERAGYLTGLLPAVGIVAVLVGGGLSFRFTQWRPMLILPGIAVGLSGFATFLLTGTAAISVAVIVLGVGTWIYQPTFHTVPMSLPWMTPDKVAVVWGASMTIAGIGQFIAPIVAGASRDVFGSFVPGFAVWSALAWSLLLVGVFLPDPSGDDQPI